MKKLELHDAKGKLIATVEGADPNQSYCDEGVFITILADDGSRPAISIVKDKASGPTGGGWYAGLYRDTRNPGVACDFALSLCPDRGPVLQVTRGTEVKTVALFDLLQKLGV